MYKYDIITQVNNAGCGIPGDSSLTVEHLDTMLQQHVKAPLILIQQLQEEIIKNKGKVKIQCNIKQISPEKQCELRVTIIKSEVLVISRSNVWMSAPRETSLGCWQSSKNGLYRGAVHPAVNATLYIIWKHAVSAVTAG